MGHLVGVDDQSDGLHASQASALTSGFQAALLAAAIFLAVAALIALRSRNATAAEVIGSAPDDQAAVPETVAAC